MHPFSISSEAEGKLDKGERGGQGKTYIDKKGYLELP